MKRLTGFVVGLLVVFGAQAAEARRACKSNEGYKTTICHAPAGDSSKAKTSCVSSSEVSAHLGHGDCLGECPCAGSDPCGDGVCDPAAGEDTESCPGDCPIETDCGNGVDDDGDGVADCADSDCAGEPSCQPRCSSAGEACAPGGAECCDELTCSTLGDPAGICAPVVETNCDNGVDDDRDDLTDCDDEEDCGADSACRPSSEINCDNNRDDDGDGLVDCDDPECFSDIGNCPGAGCSAEGEACGEGGRVCCEDLACPSLGGMDRVCVPTTETSCSNGMDDDLDGSIDCADGADCASDPSCQSTCSQQGTNCVPDSSPEACCAGLECVPTIAPNIGECGPPPTTEERGLDERDDDHDGLTDCADPDCAANGFCNPPTCTDQGSLCGVDDDPSSCCPGLDCAYRIATFGACEPPETICDDGLDQDGDGATDCADDNCSADPVCQCTLVGADCNPLLPPCCGGSRCDGPTQRCVPATETGCGNEIDDDLDDKIDCVDEDCAANPTCQCIPSGSDCRPDMDCCSGRCWGPTQTCAPHSEINCNDAADDDFDGKTDCADEDCADSPSCQAPTCSALNAWCGCVSEFCEVVTGGDFAPCCSGLTCSPDFISGFSYCIAAQQFEICDNGIDDDDDGRTDCNDSEDCSGGICSRDLPDGSTCGDDIQCESGVCSPDSCNDIFGSCTFRCGLKADGGDCFEDEDCRSGSCTGFCAGSECFRGVCEPTTEMNCGNGTDDDLDGTADCADNDCTNDPSCGSCGANGNFCAETNLPGGISCCAGLRCEKIGPLDYGVCVVDEALPDGSRCNSNDECSSGACIPGSCDIVLGCQPATCGEPGPAGGVCIRGSDCQSGICNGQLCFSDSPNDVCLRGTCQ